MTAIQPGQIYRSCDPRDNRRIKVVGRAVTMHGLYGYGQVRIVTLTDGDREVRPRAINVNQLHDSDTTKTGTKRRTGYALEQR